MALLVAGLSCLLALVALRSGSEHPDPAESPSSRCSASGPDGLSGSVDAEAATVRRLSSPAGLAAARARFSARRSLTARRPGYARLVEPVSWQPGAAVSYAGCFFLPRGFAARLQGQMALMRWDDYPSDPAHPMQGGIVVNGPGGEAMLMRDRKGGSQVELVRPFRLPAGRWFRLRVKQRLSPGGDAARNSVLLDGRLIRHSRRANLDLEMTVSRVRFGLVALPIAQRRPLTIWFRRLRTQEGGP